jgi:hypothetical protein
MQEWKFLAKHAITTYSGSAPCEYVLVGKNVVGYAEQNSSGGWTYYQFGSAEKGNTLAPAPVEKGTGKTATAAVMSGMG